MAEIFEPVGAHVSEDLEGTLTPAVPKGANVCLVQATKFDVRYKLDGTAPNATHGFLIREGQQVAIPISENTTLKLNRNNSNVIPTIEYQWGQYVESA